MIHIKKLASQRADKNAQHSVLNINDKCGVCKCVNNITSLSDLKVLLGTRDGASSMYYECPNCGSRQFLSITNACKLSKHMVSINMRPSDLLTFQNLCENAMRCRGELFDAVNFAKQKNLGIPDELYFFNESYGREITVLSTLIEQGVVTTHKEYEDYQHTLPYILSMQQDVRECRISHLSSDDGRTKYTFIIGDTETSIVVDPSGHITGWTTK